MTQKDNGGPAFPVHGNDMFGGTVTRSGGMALRDWFAGQALAGLSRDGWTDDPSIQAREAYKLADAMLAERSK